jgi:hypothetical protein
VWSSFFFASEHFIALPPTEMDCAQLGYECVPSLIYWNLIQFDILLSWEAKHLTLNVTQLLVNEEIGVKYRKWWFIKRNKFLSYFDNLVLRFYMPFTQFLMHLDIFLMFSRKTILYKTIFYCTFSHKKRIEIETTIILNYHARNV